MVTGASLQSNQGACSFSSLSNANWIEVRDSSLGLLFLFSPARRIIHIRKRGKSRYVQLGDYKSGDDMTYSLQSIQSIKIWASLPIASLIAGDVAERGISLWVGDRVADASHGAVHHRLSKKQSSPLIIDLAPLIPDRPELHTLDLFTAVDTVISVSIENGAVLNVWHGVEWIDQAPPYSSRFSLDNGFWSTK